MPYAACRNAPGLGCRPSERCLHLGQHSVAPGRGGVLVLGGTSRAGPACRTYAVPCHAVRRHNPSSARARWTPCAACPLRQTVHHGCLLGRWRAVSLNAGTGLHAAPQAAGREPPTGETRAVHARWGTRSVHALHQRTHSHSVLHIWLQLQVGRECERSRPPSDRMPALAFVPTLARVLAIPGMRNQTWRARLCSALVLPHARSPPGWGAN